MPQPRRAGRISGVMPSVFPVVFLLAAAFLSVAPAAFAQGRAALVAADPVSWVEITETVPIFANVVARRESAVASRVAGFVSRVPVSVGEQVEAGQVLAELEERPFAIARAAAQATMSVARHGREVAAIRTALAEQAFERLQSLGGSAALSRGLLEDADQELRLAQAALEEAEARIDSARAQAEGAEFDHESREVRAPFAGVVVEQRAQPGAYLREGEPVAMLLDMGSLELVAEVPAGILGGLRPGDDINGMRDSGLPMRTRVRAVLPVEDIRTRTRPVRLSMVAEGDSSGLATGETVILAVPQGGRRRVLSVAKDALIREDNGWVVFLVENGMALRRTILVGAFVEDRVEVRSGLSEGDLVVIRGNERLRPGQPVTVEKTGP